MCVCLHEENAIYFCTLVSYIHSPLTVKRNEMLVKNFNLTSVGQRNRKTPGDRISVSCRGMLGRHLQQRSLKEGKFTSHGWLSLKWSILILIQFCFNIVGLECLINRWTVERETGRTGERRHVAPAAGYALWCERVQTQHLLACSYFTTIYEEIWLHCSASLKNLKNHFILIYFMLAYWFKLENLLIVTSHGGKLNDKIHVYLQSCFSSWTLSQAARSSWEREREKPKNKPTKEVTYFPGCVSSERGHSFALWAL